jgi:HEAT repeat protein
MWRQAMIAILALATIAGAAYAGTAAQYRGPAGEAPKGLLPPSADGPIGADRLVSRSRQVEGFTRWEFWWELNRDRFLRRAAARGNGTVTEGLMFSVWGGPEKSPRWIDDSDLRIRVVRVLLSRLKSSDAEERALAAVALGKSRVSAAFGPLKNLFENGERSDRRAAAFALGLLGEPLAAPVLSGFVAKKSAPYADRAYAALGLGLLGSDDSIPVLEKALASSLGIRGRAVADFQSAAAASLGILGGESSVDVLSRMAMARTGIDDKARASALVALGRIANDKALAVLVKSIRSNDLDLRRAAAQGLGLSKRAEARAPLMTAFLKDGDVQVRNFAAMSLARIGGPNVANALAMGLELRNPRALRGFSALALGVLGDASQKPTLRKLLVKKDEKSLVGAAAIALGILNDRGAIPALRRISRDDTRDDDLRGYATLALAMMGDRPTAGRIPTVLKSLDRADLRRSAAISLGLYWKFRAGPSVLRALLTDSDPYVRGAAIASLGYAPRQNVLPMLVDVASEDGYRGVARKDAIAALGAMAARGHASSLEKLYDGLNYRSLTGSLRYATLMF